jgi:type IV secretion system protein VirD4
MIIDTFIKSLTITHPIVDNFQTIKMSGDKTRASFFAGGMSTLNIFTDPEIAMLTSESEIDLNKIAEGKKKYALFMILPDEKSTYYPICSLFVNQLYQELVEVADNEKNGGRLPRRVNFILDEFGNFSKIPDFDQVLTVAGGRGIRFNLFLQSFSQLNEKYGNNVADVIFGCIIENRTPK